MNNDQNDGFDYTAEQVNEMLGAVLDQQNEQYRDIVNRLTELGDKIDQIGDEVDRATDTVESIQEDVRTEEDLYLGAKELVVLTQKAAPSFLQRVFRIRYEQASRLMDRLETEGIVSRTKGGTQWKVLVIEVEGD